MLKYGGIANLSSRPLLSVLSCENSPLSTVVNISSAVKVLKLHNQGLRCVHCTARRRVRYEDEDDDDDDKEYGHNMEIAMLESYSESARNEAILVRAMVDDQEEEVLIFKGFSSCLSYRTSSDPSRSILPARAVIKSIDRIKGPFNPSNIEYLERGLSWEAFKSRLQPN
ncbi:hypothetical protein HHK36_006717 [Tetracentron sinense]|uniref:DUF7734 domain-containing protein n=1 Tax=Tetracentron sinense TaxID=13715 RepID=A0A835DKL9_TETSI|nr:hypothetical protein HHK36_006717 [Tetracentron sinense]